MLRVAFSIFPIFIQLMFYVLLYLFIFFQYFFCYFLIGRCSFFSTFLSDGLNQICDWQEKNKKIPPPPLLPQITRTTTTTTTKKQRNTQITTCYMLSFLLFHLIIIISFLPSFLSFTFQLFNNSANKTSLKRKSIKKKQFLHNITRTNKKKEDLFFFCLLDFEIIDIFQQREYIMKRIKNQLN